MRVLRLDLSDGPVELHPFVTVVRGLPPKGREALLGALAAVPRGQATTTGLLEAHGVLLELDGPTLGLLDLHSDVDAIVRSADLPGGPSGARQAEAERALGQAVADAVAAEEAIARAARALDGARDALEAVRSGAAGEPGEGLEAPRADLEQRLLARAAAERAAADAAAEERGAAAAVNDADEAVEAARRARADATRALSVAAAALEAAADRRDPMAVTAVDAARAQLAQAEESLVELRSQEDGEAEPTPDEPPTEEELAALRAERVEAEAAVLALDTADPSPVRVALQQLRAGGIVELVADPRALALLDRWSDLEVELDHWTAHDDLDDDVVGGDARAAVRARVAAAEAAVVAAEAARRGPGLDSEEHKALEAAHAEVLEARDALDRRFKRGVAAKRLEEAEAAERAILDRLGFTTFTGYVLAAHGNPEPDIARRIEAARAELAAASAEAHQLDAAVAVELRRAELLDRRRELRTAAVELLGADPGDDVGDALRRHRVSATETGGHLARLRAALEASGLVLGDEELPERTLGDLASVWLEEQERASVERSALEQRVAELDARLADASRLRASAAASNAVSDVGVRPSRLAAGLAAVDEARSALEVAEARLARHREVQAEVDARREAFELASKEEAAAIGRVAEAEAAASEAMLAEREAAAVAADAEAAAVAARQAEAAAAELLAGLEGRLVQPSAESEAGLEDDVVRATTVLNQATIEAARSAAAVDAARAELTAVDAEAEADADAGDVDPLADAEDAEWFLLARLAAQRSVSFAGSVPLVLDDALAGFGPEPTRRLLARLERMASTVQVVVVTEDLTTAAWAEALGVERAEVVQV